MTIASLHPHWLNAPERMTDGFSLEITAKDVPALRKVAPYIPAKTPIAIAFLPGEDLEGRLAAACSIRELGFEPMPHFSARRLASMEDFQEFLTRAVREADVKRCFVVAGDPSKSMGPFSESSELIETGEFESNGITAIGVGGHPEGHPNMSADACWDVLSRKCQGIERRGMTPLIVTQFCFDSRIFLDWLAELRLRGIDAPVRIGIPGPAGIATLIHFAARCGVGASTAVMSKYGVSLTKLMGAAGPDKLVNELAAHIAPAHGPVRLHFYPFGGLERTVEWINKYSESHSL